MIFCVCFSNVCVCWWQMSKTNHNLLEPSLGISSPYEMMEGLITIEVGLLSDSEKPCLQLPQALPASITGTSGLLGCWEHSRGLGQDSDSAKVSNAQQWLSRPQLGLEAVTGSSKHNRDDPGSEPDDLTRVTSPWSSPELSGQALC